MDPFHTQEYGSGKKRIEARVTPNQKQQLNKCFPESKSKSHGVGEPAVAAPKDGGEAGAPGASGILSPSRPRRGPRGRFLGSEGSPPPQAEEHRHPRGPGALRWAAGCPSCSPRLHPPRRPAGQFQKPGGHRGPGCLRASDPDPPPAWALGPRSLLLRQSGPLLTLGNPGGETFPGERRGGSGAPRPSGEPGSGGPGLGAVPAPGSSVTAQRRGGAAARPRPGRRPGQGSASAPAPAPARAGAAAGPRRRGLFTRAAVSGCGGPGSSSSAAAPLPLAAPPPRSRPPPPRRPGPPRRPCRPGPGPRSEQERRGPEAFRGACRLRLQLGAETPQTKSSGSNKASRILVPQPGMERSPPAEAQSLNHWMDREVHLHQHPHLRTWLSRTLMIMLN
ncbi:collagen alpha-1(I) chain-like [Bos mutus]|uniref:collagen alpha-1(I) chain-like n=1 Tax=Bos mutus TaxID=72004 RepID=UPI0038B56D33